MRSPLAPLAAAIDRRVGRSAPRPSPWPTDVWRLVGHLAIAAFALLTVTGIVLALWYRPGTGPVTYSGSAGLYDGRAVPEAFATVLRISEDVPGGLLLRRVHVAAAHIFVAATVAHMLRVLFTGAFRRPRLGNHLVGVGLLLLALGMLYTGENLTYDLVAGASLRIGYAVLLSIPLVGESLGPLVFGGDFPAGDIVTRLWLLHLFVLPPLFVGGLVTHLVLVHRRTPAALPRRDVDVRRLVVGRPLWPDAIGRFALLAAGTTALVLVWSALVPWADVELEGPTLPAQGANTLHPPWSLFFLTGSLRLVPAIDLVVGPLRITNMLVAGAVFPGLLFAGLVAYPLLEQRLLGDEREHHVLAHPLAVPMRAGVAAALTAITLVLSAAAAMDVIAFWLRAPVERVAWTMRAAALLLPAAAAAVAVLLARRRNASDPAGG